MAEQSIFDELAAQLSTAERRELLERIVSRATVSEEPLFKASERLRVPAVDYESRAASLGLIARLVLAIRVMFTGKTREYLLREDDLRLIARGLESRYPGLVEHRQGVILAQAAEELKRLRDAARFFYDLLDRSVEKDRAAFFAFLFSVEMPELYGRLVAETDPFASAPEGASESDLRGAMFEAFEKVMEDMEEEGRRAMYRDLRSILFLKRLSGFLFERLLGTFHPGIGPEGSEAATFPEARDLFLELADILTSMSDPPSARLMEALFVFVEREEISKPDAEAILSADLARAESALGRIRAFNARIPLCELSRLVSGDPSYSPRELAGGEDWLVIFKAFWREHIESQVEEWKAERRRRELADEISAFVGAPGPAALPRLSAGGEGESLRVRQDAALLFLDAFFRGLFQRELARPLKLVLVDGEFYRKDNRIEYTDAYDALLKVPDAIASLDARLGPEGELGSAWARAKAEIAPAQVKRRKLQGAERDAEDEAERVVRAAAEAFVAMVKLLGGILKGEAGGRYDSLSNVSFLDGKANKDFLKTLAAAKDRCERALSFLAELSGLDLSGAYR
ncbi:MAG TPA: DUF5312 family protein [Spirochaetales bacterium]|nr:DUF5312 family protein [Spirochaetales bacterium]HRY55643.1 DUF5312 family protein [Spirochaetia bacterium]